MIIVGSGAGGATLAHRLAPTAKRILVLERSDWLPLSGMSLKPARTLTSAIPAARFRALWIYFLAPAAGDAAGGRLVPMVAR